MSLSTWPGYGPSSVWSVEQRPVSGTSSASSIRLHRALGMLEAKFDRATQQGGCSDTFLRLRVTVEDDDALLARLPLAWAAVRAAHPALRHTIADAEDARQYQGIPGVPMREFQHCPPASEAAAYSGALETILLEPGGVDVEGKMAQLLDEHILNGARTLLDQESCLARLIFVRDDRPSQLHDHYLVLLISHVISDGLSVIMLMRDLFDRLSSPTLPTPRHPPSFNSVTSFLNPTVECNLGSDVPASSILRAWHVALPLEETLDLLPLASEHYYPPLPARTAYSGVNFDTGASHTPLPPSVARRRWFWAISRTIIMARHAAFPRTLQLPRLASMSPPAPIHTSWPTLRFERETSTELLKFCKENSISPSMLLYSILSIALADILHRHHPHAPYSPVVIGFPHSARPFLDPTSPSIAADLAIRLKFGCIQLPFSPGQKGNGLKWTVLQGARLAKRQFTRRFALENRSLFLAEAHFAMIHRLLNSAGASPPPFNEPKTAVNASMIGDVDRLLPSSFSIPGFSSPSGQTSLRLSQLLIGTRLHPGEGMLIEAYTFDGLVTMSFGFDSSIFARAQVDEILNQLTDSLQLTMLTGDEVAKHTSKDDLWMIIEGKVYDLTKFAPEHPGGQKILLKWAGKDATEEYLPIHPKGTIEELAPECHLGPVDMSTVEKVQVEEAKAPTGAAPVTLGGCINIADIEAAAEALLKPKAFAYYASAADDERTKGWNHDSFATVRLRPRVLRDVSSADLSTTMLGHKTSLPIFIAPAAMGRLAHPEGERCLARIAGEQGIPYIVSANSSVSFDEISALRDPQNPQTLFYQLYVNKDRAKTEAQLRRVVAAGYKGICVTVDAPVAGKRERDERSKMDAESASDPSMRDAVATTATPDKPQGPQQGIAQTLGGYVDPQLSWSDLAWIRKVTDDTLPIIVKGVQTAEDAALCAKHGVQGIYLSNHGGRQLEGAPSSLETLLEIRRHEPQVFDSCEVYVDGGIKRGTDVLKALALGATAVGVGRPFMYSLVFGDDGVRKVVSILGEELATNMRLLGATSVKELVPEMVNATFLEERVVDASVYGRTGMREKVGAKVEEVTEEARGLWSRLFGKAKL